MTPLEQFKADMEYNKNNILFTMEDDAVMGERQDGFYTKDIEDNDHACVNYIFDNGHHYVIDLEENTLHPCKPIQEDYFIHKYLEKLISDFVSKWKLDKNGYKIYCNENEVSASSLIRLLPYRDQKVVYLPNIMLPMELRHKGGIGKKLIAQIYEICQKLNYRLILVDLVDSFSNSLKKRNAIFIDNDTAEITYETNLD